MPRNGRKPLTPSVIADDKAALSGLRTLVDYAPQNPAVTKAKLDTLDASCAQMEEELRQLLVQVAALRDRVADVQYDRHDGVILLRQQIIAQYGKDSDAAQAVGLKKQSEYAKPTGRTKKPSTN